MRKIIVALLMSALLLPVIQAGELSPELKIMDDQIKAASSDLNNMKNALMKELKDDPGLKAINEKKKALEKEMQDYLISKKPELVEAQKRVEDLKKQFNEAKKGAKGKDNPAKKIE